jgi:hypothetical protein
MVLNLLYTRLISCVFEHRHITAIGNLSGRVIVRWVVVCVQAPRVSLSLVHSSVACIEFLFLQTRCHDSSAPPPLPEPPM